MKIRPVGDELFHADRQMDEGNSRFSQFCELVHPVPYLTVDRPCP